MEWRLPEAWRRVKWAVIVYRYRVSVLKDEKVLEMDDVSIHRSRKKP